MRVQGMLGLCALLAAGGLAWLLEGDRMSPLALTAVEWQTRSQVPVPLYVPLALLGGVLVLTGLRRTRSRRSSSPSPVPTPAPAPASAALEGDGDQWVVAVIQQGEALGLEVGATLSFDVAAGVPVGLRLSQQTPEAERRSLETFAAYLARFPTPPRARVELEGAIPTGAALRVRHLLHRALRQVFPPDSLRVLQHSDRIIDVVFSAPDPRWGRRLRVFMDQAER